MNSFEIKHVSTDKMVAIMLGTLVLSIAISIFLCGIFEPFKFYHIIAGIVLGFLVLPLIRKRFITKMSIVFSQDQVCIQSKNKDLSIYHKDLYAIHVASQANGNPLQLKLVDRKGKLLFNIAPSNFEKDQKVASGNLLQGFLAHIDLVRINEVNISGTSGSYKCDYLNRSLIKDESPAIPKPRGNTKKQLLWIGGIFGCFIMLFLIPTLLNKKAFYEIKDGKVYYGNTILQNVNPKEFKTLTYDVAKDSSDIYFHESRIPNIDYKTFKTLERSFYKDKNGIYYVSSTFFSEHKFLPIGGEYDKKTFKSLENSNLYIDKNGIYEMQLFSDSPLKRLETKLDHKTLKAYSSILYADESGIWFFDDGEFTPVKEIDKNSFETVTYQIYKDKLHVYFIKGTLSVKETSNITTSVDKIGIIDGADGATFKQTGEDTFEDKNTSYRITEESEKVNYRNEKSGRSAE